MDEKDRLQKQLWRHMNYNILAFAIIFIIFGILISILVANITFSGVDKELKEAANKYEENNFTLNEFKFNFVDFDTTAIERAEKTFDAMRDNMLGRKINNPKITVLIRDEDGEIQNSDDIGKRYSNLVDSVPFSTNNVGKVTPVRLSDQYNYRSLIIKIDDNSNTDSERYVQLLINVDTELLLISSYFQIIAICVVAGVAMSIVASYILSKKTLAPVESTLKKQMEFVQNASHELRTPLTIIQAKQELLLQDPNAKIIDKSEEIMLTLNETKRLSKLTKDLMVLARADDNRLKLDKDRANIDELIENLVKPYAEAAEIENKELKLDLKYNNTVNVDTSKIYQVMVIVLDNAIKYTEEGDSIEVTTYDKDNRCYIEIKDTGIGISDEAIKHIFDRFYREDKSRTRSTGGSGLGLSIADAIVKAHNGAIKVSHNQPKGTVFTIRLPK